MDIRLIVFLKNPEEGKVKTRIARTAGSKKALEIYNDLLLILRDQISRAGCTVFLYFSEPPHDTSFWEGRNFIFRSQSGKDLGERMKAAFEEVFSQAGSGHGHLTKTLIVGSDCPQLTSEIIGEAFLKLDESDIVVGPAEDGGYYLLGMKKMHSSLFSDVPWSTENVLRETLDKASMAGLSVAFTPLLFDVDTESDWERWLKLRVS